MQSYTCSKFRSTFTGLNLKEWKELVKENPPGKQFGDLLAKVEIGVSGLAKTPKGMHLALIVPIAPTLPFPTTSLYWILSDPNTNNAVFPVGENENSFSQKVYRSMLGSYSVSVDPALITNLLPSLYAVSPDVGLFITDLQRDEKIKRLVRGFSQRLGLSSKLAWEKILAEPKATGA